MPTQQDLYLEKIALIHQALDIPPTYAQDRALPLQYEAHTLIEAEVDNSGKSHRLLPEAAQAWHELKQAARKDNIALILVSGYRSAQYQCELIQKKLTRGDKLEEILSLLAAPGYSEHHTGRAIDLNTEDCKPCVTAFELTPAFLWLQKNADRFGFSLSYPKNNPYGFIYEP